MFSQLCVCPHLEGTQSLSHNNFTSPMSFPGVPQWLVRGPFLEGTSVQDGGYRSPRLEYSILGYSPWPGQNEGYPSPRSGYPQPRMGYPLAKDGHPLPGWGAPKPGIGYPPDVVPPPLPPRILDGIFPTRRGGMPLAFTKEDCFIRKLFYIKWLSMRKI